MVIAGVGVAVFFLFEDVMKFANLDSENLLESFDQLSSHRSVELAKAGSGIDISGYPLPLKLFTFWFRPLFVDAPGPIGIIVSFENLFYLWLTWQLFDGRFLKFLGRSSALVKTCGVAFLATSVALSGYSFQPGYYHTAEKHGDVFLPLYHIGIYGLPERTGYQQEEKSQWPAIPHQHSPGRYHSTKPFMEGIFTISLDFELHWGVFDKKDRREREACYRNTSSAGARMLELFSKYDVHVTWATVGACLPKTKSEWEQNETGHRTAIQRGKILRLPVGIAQRHVARLSMGALCARYE